MNYTKMLQSKLTLVFLSAFLTINGHVECSTDLAPGELYGSVLTLRSLWARIYICIKYERRQKVRSKEWKRIPLI